VESRSGLQGRQLIPNAQRAGVSTVIEIDRKSVLDAARLVAAATADPARTVSSGPTREASFVLRSQACIPPGCSYIGSFCPRNFLKLSNCALIPGKQTSPLSSHTLLIIELSHQSNSSVRAKTAWIMSALFIRFAPLPR